MPRKQLQPFCVFPRLSLSKPTAVRSLCGGPRLVWLIGLAWLLLGAVGCNESPPAAPNTAVAPTPTAPDTTPVVPPTATLPLPTPTATPRPLAAVVNGAPIYLEQYEAELARYREWYPKTAPDGRDVRVYVLDLMIDQALIDQAAARQGLTVAEDELEAKIAAAIAESGGPEAYQVWLSSSGFDEQSFRAQVTAELLTQQVIAFVTRDLPTTAEFVRARYIQVDDRALADDLLRQLREGGDFAALAARHSLEPTRDITRGDLGFFSRGMLTVPAVEEAAFALAVNTLSEVIAVTRSDGSETYYLVQVTGREPFRPLSADQQAAQAQQTFEAWLAEERRAATIDVQLGFD